MYPITDSLRLAPLREAPALIEPAAAWFHTHWDVPEEAYRESMALCVRDPDCIPQWYLVLDQKDRIVAGLGIIENDFHGRKDLTPNVCAVFVEPFCRKRGVARAMLNFVRYDAGRLGLSRLYLVTDHDRFYERCGWRFLCMVACDSGEISRMYEAETLPDLPAAGSDARAEGLTERIRQYLSFVQEIEQLKNVLRCSWTSAGRRESTAEHTWHLAVLAAVVLEEFPGLDANRVLTMALLHDLGELYDGDLSAAARPDAEEKRRKEAAGMQRALAPLPERTAGRLYALWEEYEQGSTEEARLVKALDKAETILQHNQGQNPLDFDYAFNLEYGKALFQEPELLRRMRSQLDDGTRRSLERQAGLSAPFGREEE